jgi:APA family basic amino acid/polyamine antiporter
MISDLLRTKSLDEILAAPEAGHGPTLKRNLSVWALTALGIGAVIGAGIFSTVGTAAAGGADHLGAGPALILSFVLTAVAGFAGLLRRTGRHGADLRLRLHLRLRHARRAGRLDHRLGPDHRVRRRQRRGRDLLVGLLPGAAARLRHSVAGLARARLPERRRGRVAGRRGKDAAAEVGAAAVRMAQALADAPHFGSFALVFNLPAFLIVMLITVILVRGIRESASFNSWMVGLKLAIIAFFLGMGAFYVKPENWTPFAPNGFQGIAGAAAIIFFAYIGFDAVSTASERASTRSATCRSPSSGAWPSAR